MIRRAMGRSGRPSLIGPAPADGALPDTAVPDGAPADRLIDQLTALAALKDRGVLTDEEFALQKAAILRSA